MVPDYKLGVLAQWQRDNEPNMHRFDALTDQEKRGVLEFVLGAYINAVEDSGVEIDAACRKALRMLPYALQYVEGKEVQ